MNKIVLLGYKLNKNMAFAKRLGNAFTLLYAILKNILKKSVIMSSFE